MRFTEAEEAAENPVFIQEHHTTLNTSKAEHD